VTFIAISQQVVFVKALSRQSTSFSEPTLNPYASSLLASRLLDLLLGDYNMPSTFVDFAASPAGILLVLFFSSFVLGSLVRVVAHRTVLPAVRQFLLEQQQRRRQELERQARLHFHLNDVRRRAMAVAAAAEHVERVLADRAWLRDMEDRGHRQQEAIQAQEPAVAARQAEEHAAYLRRELEIKLGQLEVEDRHREDAVVFAKYNDDKQQYRPAKDGLLYDSDDEDPEVIRGDKKGKKDK
jgi:hypothetical protein